jgi:DNA-binding CsgD family transcriptional regulator
VKRAAGCRCTRPLVFADDPEHCCRCGHGPCAPLLAVRVTRRRRLPWDLGALQREGRRPDPHLENVVRFDRLRPGPRAVLMLVEPGEPELPAVEALGLLTDREAQVLNAFAAGHATRLRVADRLGIDTQGVTNAMTGVYRKLGINPWDGGHKAARQAAVDWWLSAHEGRLAA